MAPDCESLVLADFKPSDNPNDRTYRIDIRLVGIGDDLQGPRLKGLLLDWLATDAELGTFINKTGDKLRLENTTRYDAMFTEEEPR